MRIGRRFGGREAKLASFRKKSKVRGDFLEDMYLSFTALGRRRVRHCEILREMESKGWNRRTIIRKVKQAVKEDILKKIEVSKAETYYEMLKLKAEYEPLELAKKAWTICRDAHWYYFQHGLMEQYVLGLPHKRLLAFTAENEKAGKQLTPFEHKLLKRLLELIEMASDVYVNLRLSLVLRRKKIFYKNVNVVRRIIVADLSDSLFNDILDQIGFFNGEIKRITKDELLKIQKRHNPSILKRINQFAKMLEYEEVQWVDDIRNSYQEQYEEAIKEIFRTLCILLVPSTTLLRD
ncbi:MAG: hypothetical protein QXX08_04680 [Candidatus Bathyarchaeia archaeon]